MTTMNATRILADEAERMGADANDDKGVVRQVVLAHGLSFCAWLCVCCELADRDAQRQGFTGQADRAAHLHAREKALYSKRGELQAAIAIAESEKARVRKPHKPAAPKSERIC